RDDLVLAGGSFHEAAEHAERVVADPRPRQRQRRDVDDDPHPASALLDRSDERGRAHVSKPGDAFADAVDRDLAAVADRNARDAELDLELLARRERVRQERSRQLEALPAGLRHVWAERDDAFRGPARGPEAPARVPHA